MLKCVIIDDEPLPLELLSDYDSKIRNLEVIANLIIQSNRLNLS